MAEKWDGRTSAWSLQELAVQMKKICSRRTWQRERPCALALAGLLSLAGRDAAGYGSNHHAALPFLVADMPQLREPVKGMIKSHAKYARIGAALQDSGNLRRGELDSCTRRDGMLDSAKVVDILRKRRHPVAQIADEVAQWGMAEQWAWMSSHDPLTPEWYADAIHEAIAEKNGKKVAFMCGAVTHLAECLIGYHSRAMAVHGPSGKTYRREIEMGGRAPRIDFDAAQKQAIDSFAKEEQDESLEAWHRRYLAQRYSVWYPQVLRWRIADEEPGTPEHLRRATELGLFESVNVLKFCVKLFNEAIEGPRRDRYSGADVLVVVHSGLRDGAHLSYLSLMAKNGIPYEVCASPAVPELSKYRAAVVLAGRYQKGMRAFASRLAEYLNRGGQVVLVGEPVFGQEGEAPEWADVRDSDRLKRSRRGVEQSYENHVLIMDALRAFWGADRVPANAAETPESLCALAREYRRKVSYRHIERPVEISDEEEPSMAIFLDLASGLADCTGGWIDLDGSRAEHKIPFDMAELAARAIDGRPIIKAVPDEGSILFESGRRIVFLAKEVRLPDRAAKIVLGLSYRLTDSRRGTRRLQLFASQRAGEPTCLLDDRIRGDNTVKDYALDLTRYAGRSVKLELRLRNTGIYNYVGRSLLVKPRILIQHKSTSSRPKPAPQPEGFGYCYRLRGPDLPIPANSCPIVGDWDLDGDADLAVVGTPFDLAFCCGVLPSPVAGPRSVRSVPFAAGLTAKGLELHPGDAIDFDRDGDCDLVLGTTDGRILLHENTQVAGTPVFFVRGPRVILDVRAKVSVIPAVVDWDRDGRADLVVGHEDGRIALFLASSDWPESNFRPGTFLSTREGKPVAVEGRAAPEAVDWDGDEDLDIVVGDEEGRFWLFVNQGSRAKPVFGPAQKLDSVVCSGLATPQVHDWDGDGDFDLLVGGADGEVAVFVNEGPPNRPRLTPAGTVRGTAFGNHLPAPQWPSAVDWDSDGDLDLILSGFKLYRNTSSAACPSFDESAIRIHGLPRAGACVADWDNDGDHDILHVDRQRPHLLKIMENRGTPRHPKFGAEGQTVLVDGRPLETPPAKGQYVGPWGHTAKLCVTDWDGDGKKDLLVGAKEVHVHVHLNAGSDTSPALGPAVPIKDREGKPITDSRRNVCGVSVGDVDNDGRKDLVVTRYASVNWYRNTADAGRPVYEPARRITELGDTRNPVVQVVDWNRDGQSDLLAYTMGKMGLGLHLLSRVEIPELAPPERSPHAKGVNITIGPYLQNVRKDAITICWRTGTPAGSKVEYGESPDLSEATASAEPTRRHEVAVSGLVPGRTYHYRVRSGAVRSRISTFTTAPAGNAPFRFVVYSDAQRANYDHVRTVRRVGKLDPDLVIYCGDQCRFGDFMYIVSDVFRWTPFFPCIGNTDLSFSERDRFLAFKANYVLPHNERFYSFDYGNAHFVALNSFEDYREGSPQHAWLASDLEAASKTSRFIFVYFHVPPYSSGSHGKQKACLDHRKLSPLFEAHGVAAVFNGHDHSYERCLVNRVHYIVTGGGAQTRGVGRTEWTVYSERTLECVLVVVDETSAKFAGVRPDGSRFDEFVLRKGR